MKIKFHHKSEKKMNTLHEDLCTFAIIMGTLYEDLCTFTIILGTLHEDLCTFTIILGTLHEDLCTFTITSHRILVRMRNVSDKSCSENQNTRFIFHNFFSENRAVYEIMWKNVVEPDRPKTTT